MFYEKFPMSRELIDTLWNVNYIIGEILEDLHSN